MERLIKLFSIVLLVIFSSCDNEPADLTTIATEEIIKVDSELYNMLEKISNNQDTTETIVCIDFIYAFTLYIYNSDLEFIGLQTIHNDQEFSDLLGSLEEERSISLSYPITSTLDNGDQITINNNEELKTAIDSCLKEETFGICTGMLLQKKCVWKIANNPEGNNDFENAYFNIDQSGIASFYFDSDVYFGTWVLFFIEDELHLNINLDDDGIIAENWNFDWKVTIVSDSEILLKNNEENTFIIELKCQDTEECSQLLFEACELNEGEAIAEFNLEDYITCINNFFEFNDTSDLIITFHETLEDMENDVNSLSSPYTNTSNPQNIFVRFENNETNVATFGTIQLNAISCDLD